MRTPRLPSHARLAVLCLALPAVAPSGLAAVRPPVHAAACPAASAAQAPAPQLPPALVPAGPDFLFGPPRLSFALRVGYHRARTEGRIFASAMEWLTLGSRDFDAPALSAEFGVHLAGPLEAVLGAGYAHAEAHSSLREYEREGGGPIEQTTRFTQLPLTAGVRLFLLPRGRTVGRLAWVPAAAAVYVGAGAGAVRYRFVQAGEFVDAATHEIFADHLGAAGWALLAYAAAGGELRVGTRAAVALEARYARGSAGLGGDFERFERPGSLGLGGLETTAGLSWKF